MMNVFELEFEMSGSEVVRTRVLVERDGVVEAWYREESSNEPYDMDGGCVSSEEFANALVLGVEQDAEIIVVHL